MPHNPHGRDDMRSAEATIAELLEHHSRMRPLHVAIEAMGRAPLDYRHLWSQVRASAAALASVGCTRERRVAVAMPAQPETTVVNLVMAAVATSVPLNPAYTEIELERLIRRLRVSLLLTTPDLVAPRRAARAVGVPVLEVATEDRGRAGEFHLRVDSRDGPWLGEPTTADELLARAADETALVLHTSGSTGLPKIVPLTHRNLIVSAGNVAASLQLSSDDVCLNAMPPFHVGALVDLLLAPLSVGGRVIVGVGPGAADFFAHVDALQPTWYQGVPTMLQDILRHCERGQRSLRGSRIRFIRSVSAPLPPAVLTELERQLEVPVVEIYGMTETSGVITSNPLPPGERRAGSVGISAGPEIAIVAANGQRIFDGTPGEVWVRGLNVTSAYELGPEEPAEGRVDDWLKTGDEGRLDEDGYLYLTGRIKDIINRGGEKIAPREIDEVLLAHPGVRDAAAFALPHETLGEDVAAAVVLETGYVVDAAELTAHCAERLAPFKVPRAVFFRDELPRAPGGKLQRAKLRTSCDEPDASVPPRAGGGAPASERQRLLMAVWQEVLGVGAVGAHDDFVDLGGDSLRAVELAVRVSERLGFEVQAATIYDNPTVHRLDAALDDLPAERRVGGDEAMLSELRGFLSTWEGDRPTPNGLLVGRNTAGQRPPLFWGVQSYGELCDFADRMGPDQPVYAMRSLYRTQNKSAENSAGLARRYLSEIMAFQPEGPVRLGGYCAGGGIAFDVARGLESMGRHVATLCLVEYFRGEPYAGRVAFFFHVDSGWHPFRTVDPTWLAHFTGEVRLYPNHAGHRGAHLDPGVIAAVRHELGRRASTSACLAGESWVTGVVAVPRVMVSRSSRRIEVSIENRGEGTWPAGTAVYSRWGRPRSDRASFDAVATVEQDIAPGRPVTVRLDVQAPLSPGPWNLSFDVVPGGDWNAAVRETVARGLVTVLPGAAALSWVGDRLHRVAPASLLRRLTGRTA